MQQILPAIYTPALIISVQKHIDSWNVKGEGVKAWAIIMKVLREHKLAEFGVQLDCEIVGVSPKNRSSMGVDAWGAQSHGDEILRVGYDKAKASDATCIQVPPPPLDKEMIDFNNQLEQQSKDSIPPIRALKNVSIGGSHTNTFCRQVKRGVKCLITDPAKLDPDENGHLSYDNLTAGRPEFKEAVDNGMHWTVLHWGVPLAWPDLLDLAQEALNVVCATRQGEIEIMLKVARLAAVAETAGNEVDWQRLTKQAAHGNPPCKLYADKIVNYVKKYSGGIDYPLLQELSNHKKTFGVIAGGQQRRVLGGEFIGRAVALQFGKLENYPYLVNGALKANISCSKHKIIDGVCAACCSPSV